MLYRPNVVLVAAGAVEELLPVGHFGLRISSLTLQGLVSTLIPTEDCCQFAAKK
jgi:hypothetical protein